MAFDDGVLAANTAFYDAFRRGDVAAMERLWAERAMVACVHPGRIPLFGRAAVLESWNLILTGPGRPAITCSNAVVHRLGPESAFVVCIEVLPGGPLAATNVFVREDGRWKLTQHHAGFVARPGPDTSGGETIH
jgi:ketosteroid isomerase-like protein